MNGLCVFVIAAMASAGMVMAADCNMHGKECALCQEDDTAPDDGFWFEKMDDVEGVLAGPDDVPDMMGWGGRLLEYPAECKAEGRTANGASTWDDQAVCERNCGRCDQCYHGTYPGGGDAWKAKGVQSPWGGKVTWGSEDYMEVKPKDNCDSYTCSDPANSDADCTYSGNKGICGGSGSCQRVDGNASLPFQCKACTAGYGGWVFSKEVQESPTVFIFSEKLSVAAGDCTDLPGQKGCIAFFPAMQDSFIVKKGMEAPDHGIFCTSFPESDAMKAAAAIGLVVAIGAAGAVGAAGAASNAAAGGGGGGGAGGAGAAVADAAQTASSLAQAGGSHPFIRKISVIQLIALTGSVDGFDKVLGALVTPLGLFGLQGIPAPWQFGKKVYAFGKLNLSAGQAFWEANVFWVLIVFLALRLICHLKKDKWGETLDKWTIIYLGSMYLPLATSTFYVVGHAGTPGMIEMPQLGGAALTFVIYVIGFPVFLWRKIGNAAQRDFYEADKGVEGEATWCSRLRKNLKRGEWNEDKLDGVWKKHITDFVYASRRFTVTEMLFKLVLGLVLGGLKNNKEAIAFGYQTILMVLLHLGMMLTWVIRRPSVDNRKNFEMFVVHLDQLISMAIVVVTLMANSPFGAGLFYILLFFQTMCALVILQRDIKGMIKSLMLIPKMLCGKKDEKEGIELRE